MLCNYSPSGNHVGQSPFPTSLTPTQTATLTPTETPPTPTPRPVARQMNSAATPIPAPTPVTRLVTSAPTPTPAANPKANAECDVCKNVQQLTAQVEQLRQRIGESPKPATPRAGTSLLFAFATNQLGYDTGIAISNTTLDKGTGLGAVPLQGFCILNYYCGQANCTSPPQQTTTSPIPAGLQLTFTLSGGGNYGISATPGFQGYIIAECQFSYARGYAFITAQGSLPTSAGANTGYMAEIIEDRPGVVRRTIYQNRP